MMYFRSFLLTMLGIFLLVSCRDDMNSPSSTRRPVLFTPVITGDGVISRAANDSWDADDRIGIYMVSHKNDATASANLSSAITENMQYRASESGTSSPLVAVGSQIFYPSDRSEVNFVAYYPYKSDVHTTHNHIYPVNVSTQTSLSDIDLLYHKDTATPHRHGEGMISLGFSHQLSKLNVRVVRENATIADFSTATSSIGLEGLPRQAEFDLSTGILDNLSNPSTSDNLIVPNKDTIVSNADSIVFESIVIPHNGANYTRTIHVDIDGTTYSYTLPKTRNFESGKAYSYRLILTERGLELGENTITDWGSVAIGDIEFSVSTNLIELSAAATTGNTFTIKTNSAPTPTCSISTNAANVTDPETNWITSSNLTLTSDTDGWKTYTVSFDTSANTSETIANELYFHLTIAEGKTLLVKVKQEKATYLSEPNNTANCVLTFGPVDQSSSFWLRTNSPETIAQLTYTSDGSTPISKPDWLIVGTPIRTADANGIATFTVNLSVTYNPIITSRTAYIHITIGGLTRRVQVQQNGINLAELTVVVPEHESNCYMIAPGGRSLRFPIRRAITHGGLGVDGYVTVETLWDDTEEGVISTPTIVPTASGSYVSITTKSNGSGNALIAIKNSYGNIFWSYHIWVTEYTGTETWGNNGFTVMDRNLGAAFAGIGRFMWGTGLFYQWGRKDPFHSTIVETETIVGPIDQATAHQNPDKYITALWGENDWLSTPNDTLWNNNGNKTVFDPCPYGWRIPACNSLEESPWGGMDYSQILDDNNKTMGNDWGPNGIYPVTGFRVSHDSGYIHQYFGSFISVAGGHGAGISMQQDPHSGDAILTFSSQGNSGYGMSIRCVRE